MMKDKLLECIHLLEEYRELFIEDGEKSAEEILVYSVCSKINSVLGEIHEYEEAKKMTKKHPKALYL